MGLNDSERAFSNRAILTRTGRTADIHRGAGVGRTFSNSNMCEQDVVLRPDRSNG